MTVKTRSYGIPGEYELVTATGQSTGYDIRRCAWDNAGTTGINSPRPLWIVEEQGTYRVLHEATSKRDALAWAQTNITEETA